MTYGYTFDQQTRDKLSKAVETKDNTTLNKIIMEIQQPVIDKLDQIRAILGLEKQH